MSDLTTKFDDREIRIQKLISLHKQMKSENLHLVSANRKLEFELKEERNKISLLEATLDGMKQNGKEMANRNITGIKQKINEMISEIDRSVTLINSQNNK